jgi:hypothetical protein
VDSGDVDEGVQAVAEFGQGGVGLFDDQGEQLATLAIVQLTGCAAAMGTGSDGPGLTAAL